MAEFSEYLHNLKPLSGLDMNMEEFKQVPQPNPSFSESFGASEFSVDSFLTYQQPQKRYQIEANCNLQQHQDQEAEFSESFCNNHDQLGGFRSSPDVVSAEQIGVPENKKRKACTSKNITTSASNENEQNKVRICKKGKRKEVEIKEEEVIHVRAKRGQATDSHSIAERVRREKINNKLRCLQELVPACHKSMGMAVMLEEIINYVLSLQNQVEFLSMELAAASGSYDLNMECLRQYGGTNSSDEQQKWRTQLFQLFHSTSSI